MNQGYLISPGTHIIRETSSQEEEWPTWRASDSTGVNHALSHHPSAHPSPVVQMMWVKQMKSEGKRNTTVVKVRHGSPHVIHLIHAHSQGLPLILELCHTLPYGRDARGRGLHHVLNLVLPWGLRSSWTLLSVPYLISPPYSLSHLRFDHREYGKVRRYKVNNKRTWNYLLLHHFLPTNQGLLQPIMYTNNMKNKWLSVAHHSLT